MKRLIRKSISDDDKNKMKIKLENFMGIIVENINLKGVGDNIQLKGGIIKKIKPMNFQEEIVENWYCNIEFLSEKEGKIKYIEAPVYVNDNNELCNIDGDVIADKISEEEMNNYEEKILEKNQHVEYDHSMSDFKRENLEKIKQKLSNFYGKFVINYAIQGMRIPEKSIIKQIIPIKNQKQSGRFYCNMIVNINNKDVSFREICLFYDVLNGDLYCGDDLIASSIN